MHNGTGRVGIPNSVLVIQYSGPSALSHFWMGSVLVQGEGKVLSDMPTASASLAAGTYAARPHARRDGDRALSETRNFNTTRPPRGREIATLAPVLPV
jgi:hypothetical protein